jgi:hypothetical protein
MNRLISRFVVAGIILAISWIGYQISDVTDCDGPKANAWAEASIARMEAADVDYQSLSGSTTSSQFSAFAQKAEARYRAQLNQNTISCLDVLQEKFVEFFYDEWKMYETAAQGDFDAAEAYDIQSVQASEAIQRELDRLAAKYDWDL